MHQPADSVNRLILFHKPRGLVVTRSDERNRKTVYDRLPPFFKEGGWVPVGRLDKESRGLLLFTRHGYLVDRLTRPGYCTKIYEVVIRGRLSDKNFSQALRGIETPWGVLGVHALEIMREIGPKTFIRVTLTEGKNRHIRRLFHSFEDPAMHTPLKVLDLKRVQIGSLKLDIPSGQWRYVTENEETNLLAALPAPGPFPGNNPATT
jgi:23S rRNA pseudouridine2605 synthase